MPGENESLDENVKIESNDELKLDFSDEVKPKTEIKDELKVSKFQNEFMMSSFLPKNERIF